ncbi:MAG: amino acid adenylation domain-containing protein [Candidatus Aminicenantes bacterium]|nr:amino acid adenylation domain-containing protein [Candidatus Aminicenantes bacterium]
MKHKRPGDELIVAAEQNIKEKDYWLNRLAGDLEKTSFPRDFKRGEKEARGNRVEFRFSGALFAGLNKLSGGSDYALNAVLTACTALLLHKYSGSNDIITGAPIYKQEEEGDFINTALALRSRLEKNMTFKDLLLQVRQTLSEAAENQDYPIEMLARQLDISSSGGVTGGAGEFPLFDVAVLLENIHDRDCISHIETGILFSFLKNESAISVKIEFDESSYSVSTIERIAAHYEFLLSAALACPDEKISALSLLSEEEKKQLLFDFNDTGSDYPGHKTIHELFAEQTGRTPDKIAAVGLRAGEVSLTYRQLDREAGLLAQRLVRQGVAAETVVALLVERSLEMVVGFLAILKAGGAYLPIDTGYPVERKRFMLKDSNVPLLLTCADLQEEVEQLENPGLNVILIDRPGKNTAAGAVPQSKKEDETSPHEQGISGSLAYIMYTSGSTGIPKGVMVEHKNVVRLVKNTDYAELSGETRILQTGAPVFDATTFEVWGALLNGGGLYLVDKEVILDAGKLGKALSKNKINTLWLSSPLFNQLMQQDSRIFSPLRYLLVGGDVLSPRFIDMVRKQHPDLKVINGYGPTENTTFSTTYSIDRDFTADIPIGRPIANSTAYILDNNGRTQPIGVFGELYVGGDGVSRGYLNNPELTAEKFVGAAHPPSENHTAQPSPITNHQSPLTLYRTGDRCRRLPDGNIAFAGRIDRQVKIRGFRVELEEIEARLSAFPGVEEAIVLVRGDEAAEKHICAYVAAGNGQEGSEALSPAGLREYLSRLLPVYMIPSFFVILDKMPLNRNGKVDRKALPDPGKRPAAGEYTAPRDETEKKLAEIWAEVLGLPQAGLPGIDEDFFEIGGHSLKATKLAYQVYKDFAVNLELGEIFSRPTIRELAGVIKAAEKKEYVEIAAVKESDYYDLSYAQQRLWIICQFEDESTAYNLPGAFVVSGDFDLAAFGRALQDMTDRHESLRTLFVIVDSQPKQKILKNHTFRLEQQDLRSFDAEPGEEETRKIYRSFADRPFNLEKGPLFRVKILLLPDKKFLLMYNIHHIITDGWSQGLLFNEVVTLYNARLQNEEKPLPPLKVQYKDYSAWHNALVDSDCFSEAGQYWLEKFKDKPNGIELPLDFPRKSRQTFNGGTIPFTVAAGTARNLHRFCRGQDVTLFMALLALFNIFMYKITGQQDIILGSPIAGRKQPELQNMIGFLVNTLVFRSRVDPQGSLKELLAEVKKETLECYRHQDYPFNLLVERLDLDRDISQSPLFNVMIAHNNTETEDEALRMGGVDLEPYIHSSDFNMSVFDLILFIEEGKGELYGSLMYNSDLFERSTVQRLIENFLFLVENTVSPGIPGKKAGISLDSGMEAGAASTDRAAAGRADDPIADLPYMAEAEYEKVVESFNDTGAAFSSLTLQELFQRQVEKNPRKIAVVGLGNGGLENEAKENRAKESGDRPAPAQPEDPASGYGDSPTITYEELNTKANRFAFYLREEQGVKPNDVVGVSMERSIDMIAVLLGIIKSGAAYLAVDPTYPRDRVLHVLSDSQSALLVIDKMRPELFGDYRGKILDVTKLWGKIENYPAQNPEVVNQPTDILYVNYTSGSTGTPNGAMLSHDCLTNLIDWQEQKTSIDCSLLVLQFTSINFCVSFQEIMGALTGGGELHLIGDIERQDIDYLMDFLSRHRIEVLFLPFSYLNFLFNESSRWDRSFDHSLKHIVTAGEQLKITAGLKRFLDLNPTLQLHNHYGSTEMHVVTSYTLDAATAAQTPIPPAGKPISNVKIYILDEHLEPVPMGVWGELFAAGSSEILGYIDNDALNAEKLILHPSLSLAGQKLYRTGDMGRWREDGNIELRGRKDFQVKIRGFRVEPGEIESKILAMEKVRQCVVVVKEDAAGQKVLLAYVVLGGVEADEIKRMLGSNLPQYMVPRFVVLDSLPLMPNGKVDRDRLPEPVLEDAQLPAADCAAVNRLLEKGVFPYVNRVDDSLLAGKTYLEQVLAQYTYLVRETFSGGAVPAAGIQAGGIDIEIAPAAAEDTPFPAQDGENRGQRLLSLFEQQVEDNPGKTAVVVTEIEEENYKSQNTNYKQIAEQAERLAALLAERGIVPGTAAGIMMAPGTDMVAAELALLKTGGAYVPIDPGRSSASVTAALEKNRAMVLLTDAAALEHHSFFLLRGLESKQVQPIVTPSRAQITDFDGLPLPDRSLISYNHYNKKIGLAMVKHTVTIQASRGCPYNCLYCHKIWPKKHVFRSAENIFAEVKLYYDMGLRRFVFVDDIFNLDVENSTRFFRLLIDNGLKVFLFFPNGLRTDLLTKEYIDLMVEAGTVSLGLALETASPRLQKLIKKNMKLEKLRENVEYLCKKHPQVILELFLMHGFPTETEEEAGLTLDFLKSLQWIDFPYLHILKIYPHTDMAEMAIKHGVSGESIKRSANLAFHQLPETLPFAKSFTKGIQAEFLNDYFLLKERLLKKLPYQMKVLSEDEIVQKYNSYLPTPIKSFAELLRFAGIEAEEVGSRDFIAEESVSVPDLESCLEAHFPAIKPAGDALRILLLDLSQFFSSERDILYDGMEPPLGLLYLLTYLNRHLGSKINGKIAKSRIDFDNYAGLKNLLDTFKPDVIGIRTLTYYSDFFHKTLALLRQWGIDVPVIAGGPYATSDYERVLRDPAVDVVVLSEGEVTFLELVEKILENSGALPADDVLKNIAGLAFVPQTERSERRGLREVVLVGDGASLSSDEENAHQTYSLNKPKFCVGAGGSFSTPRRGEPMKGFQAADKRFANKKFCGGAGGSFSKEPPARRRQEENEPGELIASFLFDGSPEQVLRPLSRGGSVYILPPQWRSSVFQKLFFYKTAENSVHLRLELKKGFAATAAAAAVPRSEVEHKLALIWSEVLDTAKERIGIDDNFFELGGHSLKATLIVSRIHKEFDKKIALVEIFKTPTIREIARLVSRGGQDKFMDLETVEKQEYYELSYNQKRLFLLDQIDLESAVFNMPGLIRLEEELDETLLEKVVHLMVQRHESLRTGFKIVNDNPVQYVTTAVESPLKKIDLSALPEVEKKRRKEQALAETAEKPFDLTQAPLFRALLIKLADSSYEFVYNLHHIITDGWSLQILEGDFYRFYESCKTGREVDIEPLRVQYKDFAAWQNRRVNQPEKGREARLFWRRKLAAGVTALQLPEDFSEAKESRQGAVYRYVIRREIKEQLKKAAGEHNTSLFVVMFSAFLVLLSRFSDQEEITCSIIGAGREHTALHGIIGFFINSILFKTPVDRGAGFADFLQRVHREVMETFEHQGYPIELVLEELNMRYPEVPVSFNMFNAQDATREQELSDCESRHIPGAQDVKFDIEPYVMEYKNGIEISCAYKRKVYKPGTIEYINAEYVKILEYVTRNPDESLHAYRQKEEKESIW